MTEPIRVYAEMLELYPLMEEMLYSGGEVVFIPNGKSMLPFLYSGRNPVTLVRPGGGDPESGFNHYRVGDILFYRRASGQFVLHRLMEIKKGQPVFCGDAGTKLEYHIPRQSVLAMVIRFQWGRYTVNCRKNYLYRLLAWGWRISFPVRPYLLFTGRVIKRLFRMKKN